MPGPECGYALVSGMIPFTDMKPSSTDPKSQDACRLPVLTPWRLRRDRGRKLNQRWLDEARSGLSVAPCATSRGKYTGLFQFYCLKFIELLISAMRMETACAQL